MNLTISKEQIINGLQAVQNVVSTRTTLPILSNVLLRAENNRLEFTATDLDVTIACGVEAKVIKPALPPSRLKSSLASYGNFPTRKSSWKWTKKITVASVPALPFTKSTAWAPMNSRPSRCSLRKRKVVLPQETVKSMMRKTSFAISTDESRYVLNGIFISLKDHKMTMVATDGRRLALVDEEVDISEKSQGEFIVPAKAVNELNRLLQDKGEVEIQYGENQASFTSKRESGLDPDRHQAHRRELPQLPPGHPRRDQGTRRVGPEEFLHALKRAEIMTSEKSNSVKLSFGKNRLEITANSPEIGEAKETLAVNYKGVDMAIAFNPKYMIDPSTPCPTTKSSSNSSMS